MEKLCPHKPREAGASLASEPGPSFSPERRGPGQLQFSASAFVTNTRTVF